MGEGREALIFDMDGVLVDVSGSFRRIVTTLAAEMTGRDVEPGEVQAVKEAGGCNDDIDTIVEIARRRGVRADPAQVRRRFDAAYQGRDGSPGLWREERWMMSAGRLERLAGRRALGIATGRNREEVALARKLAADAWRWFEAVVTVDDVPPGRGKPRPDSLLLALERLGAAGGTYVGDTVDDVRAARAAGLRPLGVIPPGVGAGERLRGLMLDEGAHAVMDDLTQLERHVGDGDGVRTARP